MYITVSVCVDCVVVSLCISRGSLLSQDIFLRSCYGISRCVFCLERSTRRTWETKTIFYLKPSYPFLRYPDREQKF